MNDQNKLLIAKIEDKYQLCQNKNKITYTDFLNMAEISIIKKFLKEEKINNYIFYGVREEADRKCLIFYPEKFNDENILQKNYENIFKIIKIKLPNEISYEHREILSGIMKLGIKREKFGDIVITSYGADIITLAELAEYLAQGLKELTRFKKSEITIENIKNLYDIKNEYEDISIIVSSIRLDNFVAELAKCSRGKASEIIKQGRVFLNSLNEFREGKKLNINDIITIRGKGKFIFDKIERETKSGRILIMLRKYK